MREQLIDPERWIDDAVRDDPTFDDPQGIDERVNDKRLETRKRKVIDSSRGKERVTSVN